MDDVIPVADLASPYAGNPSGHDELVDSAGTVREHWAAIASQYDRLGHHELLRRRDEIQRLLEQDGVTYNLVGRRRPTRPWRLDPIPLVIGTDEWRGLEQASLQRAELLNEILVDLYGERRLLRSGSIPPEMILRDPQFLRACNGITVPGAKQLVVAATDLIRDPDGRWQAIGHRTQAPSGASYTLENRRAMARVFPQLIRDCGVQRVAPYIDALRSALVAAAPHGVDDPSIVVLSPGPMSETAFEHASIAAELGVPLVQGADFQIRGGRVGLRAVGGWTPVHVILRRVDAEFCDPLALRSDSTLGVPGLVDACRAGTVSVVNTLGSGVLENAGLGAILDDLCREVLGSDLIVESVPTWWCGDGASRSHVLANLDDMIVRPLSRLSRQHAIDTRRLDGDLRAEVRDRILASPGQWVGQQRVEPATAPVLTADGLEPRQTVLRTFSIASGDGYVAMPGGLARTSAGSVGSLISNRTGAIAKDTWVLRALSETEPDVFAPPAGPLHDEREITLPARAAEHLFWLGRYAERAEATIRLVRSVNTRRDEFDMVTAGPGPAALVVLLEALTRVTGTFPGFVGDDAGSLIDEPVDELVGLITDDDRPGTIAHAVRYMFDAIEVLRDQLSVDTWLVVGSLQRELERLHTETSAAVPAGSGETGTGPSAEPERNVERVAGRAVDSAEPNDPDSLPQAATLADDPDSPPVTDPAMPAAGPTGIEAGNAAGEAALGLAAKATLGEGADVALGLDEPPADEAGDPDEIMASTLDSMLQSLLALAGLADESMVRDQGWQFMEAGRRIERAMQVAALVGSTLATDRSAPVEHLVLESMLAAGESVITARRRYRSQPRPVTAIELVFGDAINPRSLRFQIDRLGESLRALAAERPAAIADAIARYYRLVQLVDAAEWTVLAAADGSGNRSALISFVYDVRQELGRISDAIGLHSFSRPHPQISMATTPSSSTGATGLQP